MSNIVEFPLPTGMVSEEFIAELHSNAFRDLETSLRDCVKMMGITTELMLQSKTEDESLRFAVFHTADMLISLKKNTTHAGTARCGDKAPKPGATIRRPPGVKAGRPPYLLLPDSFRRSPRRPRAHQRSCIWRLDPRRSVPNGALWLSFCATAPPHSSRKTIPSTMPMVSPTSAVVAAPGFGGLARERRKN
jgi:hypothetical protein